MKQSHKDNISKALKGRIPKFIPSRKGCKVSEEQKKKISESLKGRIVTWGDKISRSRKGIIFSEQHKQHIGQSHIGLKQSKETLKKRGNAMKGKLKGDKHWNWQGGKSFELYGFEWTELLKHSIIF